jgi:hypothetical protein
LTCLVSRCSFFPLVEQLIGGIASQREYANFFEGRDRGEKELWVIKSLFESMERVSDCAYEKPRIPKENPPNKIAEDKKGNVIGLEVTEVVDEETVKAYEKRRGHHKIWDGQELLGKLEQRLLDKDKRIYIGGPYFKRVLVFHADETFLDPEEIIPLMNEHEFPKTAQINEAYLLFSYDPRPRKYPYVKLHITSD